MWHLFLQYIVCQHTFICFLDVNWYFNIFIVLIVYDKHYQIYITKQTLIDQYFLLIILEYIKNQIKPL